MNLTVLLTQENVINDFELNELHRTCKQNLASRKHRGNKKEAADQGPLPDAPTTADDGESSSKEKTE